MNYLRHFAMFTMAGLLLTNTPAFAGPFYPFTQVSMCADLVKPYTEVVYNGVTYSLEQLRGGHNGRNLDTGAVVQACVTNPPVYDSSTGRWEIPVTNSLIHFSADNTPLGKITLGAVDDIVNGYLEVKDPQSFNNPNFALQDLNFPVDSIFTFSIKLELLDYGITLFSRNPITVTAYNLNSWPPPVGTTYYQESTIDLVATPGGVTIATLNPDTTIVTDVIPCSEPNALALVCIGGLVNVVASKRRRMR